MEPISVTRKMDAGSIQLFDSCQNIMILDKAIILKRRALGADALQTYMRIDFTNLLITDLDWQEDDVIKETFKFICREVKIQYRAERRDQKEGVGGTNDHMGKPIGPYGWKVLDLERKG
jgi:type VI protein secretion system component Hcp